MTTPVIVNEFSADNPPSVEALNANFKALVATINALALDTLLQFGTTATSDPKYMTVSGGSFAGAISAPAIQIGPAAGAKKDVLHVDSVATEATKGPVKLAAASADSAGAPGAAYSQAEVQAILTELRDLKAKLRTAGVLSA